MIVGSTSDSAPYPNNQNDCNESDDKSYAFTSSDNNFDSSGDTDYKNSMRTLELLEEKNRIRHKNFLFYLLVVFLALLFIGVFLLTVLELYPIAIILICIFLIILGILVSYFVVKSNGKNEHYILNLIFDFANNIVNLL